MLTEFIQIDEELMSATGAFSLDQVSFEIMSTSNMPTFIRAHGTRRSCLCSNCRRRLLEEGLSSCASVLWSRKSGRRWIGCCKAPRYFFNTQGYTPQSHFRLALTGMFGYAPVVWYPKVRPLIRKHRTRTEEGAQPGSKELYQVRRIWSESTARLQIALNSAWYLSAVT